MTHCAPPPPVRELLLSVIIPVYNERETIRVIIDKVKASGIRQQILVVDDCSTDGTREYLGSLRDPALTVLFHEHNQGKGGAIRTALSHVQGDYVLIQDADLEYDPADYPALVAPVLRDPAVAVVFGSRFKGRIQGMRRRNRLANRLLTGFTNVLFGSGISDLCTGYKLYRAEVIRGIPLERGHFDLEHELTAKLLRQNVPIVEVPISYCGRDAKSGKKVRWVDFFSNVQTLIRYRFA
jgi:glycosyltransferase involved in cell wall biosynthesis